MVVLTAIAQGRFHLGTVALGYCSGLRYLQLIHKRGAVIIAKRKLSSAMSAAKAAVDHVHDWVMGTTEVRLIDYRLIYFLVD